MKNICSKREFLVENKKLHMTIKLCRFEQVWLPSFNSNKQYLVLGSKMHKKDIFGQNKKCEHDQSLLYIQISVGTKFYVKQIILNFGNKLTQKRVVQFKTDIFKTCIFNLVLVSVFNQKG